MASPTRLKAYPVAAFFSSIGRNLAERYAVGTSGGPTNSRIHSGRLFPEIRTASERQLRRRVNPVAAIHSMILSGVIQSPLRLHSAARKVQVKEPQKTRHERYQLILGGPRVE